MTSVQYLQHPPLLSEQEGGPFPARCAHTQAFIKMLSLVIPQNLSWGLKENRNCHRLTAALNIYMLTTWQKREGFDSEMMKYCSLLAALRKQTTSPFSERSRKAFQYAVPGLRSWFSAAQKTNADTFSAFLHGSITLQSTQKATLMQTLVLHMLAYSALPR